MTTPKTAGFVEEIFVESMETIGVLEPKSTEIKKTYFQHKNTEVVKWQPLPNLLNGDQRRGRQTNFI